MVSNIPNGGFLPISKKQTTTHKPVSGINRFSMPLSDMFGIHTQNIKK